MKIHIERVILEEKMTPENREAVVRTIGGILNRIMEEECRDSAQGHAVAGALRRQELELEAEGA
jgi:hypothetical protein